MSLWSVLRHRFPLRLSIYDLAHRFELPIPFQKKTYSNNFETGIKSGQPKNAPSISFTYIQNVNASTLMEYVYWEFQT